MFLLLTLLAGFALDGGRCRSPIMCPPGTMLTGLWSVHQECMECDRVVDALVSEDGNCWCPADTMLSGARCVECDSVTGAKRDSHGQCYCAVGTLLTRGECMECDRVVGASLDKYGYGHCSCPADTLASGGQCMPCQFVDDAGLVYGRCECTADRLFIYGQCLPCDPMFGDHMDVDGLCIPCPTKVVAGQCLPCLTEMVDGQCMQCPGVFINGKCCDLTLASLFDQERDDPRGDTCQCIMQDAIAMRDDVTADDIAAGIDCTGIFTGSGENPTRGRGYADMKDGERDICKIMRRASAWPLCEF